MHEWWWDDAYARVDMDFGPVKMPTRLMRADTTPHLERTEHGGLRLTHVRAAKPEASWETAGKRAIFVRPSMKCLPV